MDHHLGFASPPPAKLQAKNDDKIRSAAKLKDRSDRAAMSYSEKTDGTVAEHEAMQSTVMNRVASGQKQYVKKGEPVTEKNVIHAPNQYQAVGGQNFVTYTRGKAIDSGARNAAKADENLKRTGKPTNDATFFVVNPGGNPPTAKQVHNLGAVTPAGRVGDVYLYMAKPPGTKH